MVALRRILVLAVLLLGGVVLLPLAEVVPSPAGSARASDCIVVDPVTGEVKVYPGNCPPSGP